MYLKKAIEINTNLARRLAHISQVDDQTAVRLGIEAIKRVKAYRDYKYPGWSLLLYGETAEPSIPSGPEGNIPPEETRLNLNPLAEG